MKCSTNFYFYLALLMTVVTGPSLLSAADPPKITASAAWGLEFAAVPDVLRMHLPAISQPGVGLLVAKRQEDLPGDQMGLLPGDVIIQADGHPISRPQDLPLPNATTGLIVLRRGQVQMLAAGDFFAGQPMAGGVFANAMPRGFGMPPLNPGGVSASSFAGGNESVSVSRKGNQFSIDMSLPGLATGPIRLRGSIQQIEKQLGESTLSAAAKRRVMQAIDQNR
ncbi:MAG: hypothetical protein WBD20_14185 [Pirellulaceae bacterium]